MRRMRQTSIFHEKRTMFLHQVRGFRPGNDEHFFHGPTPQMNHLRSLSHTFMRLFSGPFGRKCLSVPGDRA